MKRQKRKGRSDIRSMCAIKFTNGKLHFNEHCSLKFGTVYIDSQYKVSLNRFSINIWFPPLCSDNNTDANDDDGIAVCLIIPISGRDSSDCSRPYVLLQFLSL